MATEDNASRIKIMRQLVSLFAEQVGAQLNPDEAVVERVFTGMIKRYEKHGFYYCPCRVVKGTEEDWKIVCPCVHAKEEVEKNGRCHCNLLVKKETT